MKNCASDDPEHSHLADKVLNKIKNNGCENIQSCHIPISALHRFN